MIKKKENRNNHVKKEKIIKITKKYSSNKVSSFNRTLTRKEFKK
jgi:hypothetical protein